MSFKLSAGFHRLYSILMTMGLSSYPKVNGVPEVLPINYLRRTYKVCIRSMTIKDQFSQHGTFTGRLISTILIQLTIFMLLLHATSTENGEDRARNVR
jgi:hypothetical protein